MPVAQPTPSIHDSVFSVPRPMPAAPKCLPSPSVSTANNAVGADTGADRGVQIVHVVGSNGANLTKEVGPGGGSVCVWLGVGGGCGGGDGRVRARARARGTQAKRMCAWPTASPPGDLTVPWQVLERLAEEQKQEGGEGGGDGRGGWAVIS